MSISHTETGIDEVDLTDPLTFAGGDMTEWWRRVRRTDPIFQHRPVSGGQRFWVISGHAEASAVYRDAAPEDLRRVPAEAAVGVIEDDGGGHALPTYPPPPRTPAWKVDYSPGGCTTVYPLVERKSACQRDPSCERPLVSKRTPAMTMYMWPPLA